MKTHGMSNTRFYKRYAAMRSRCYRVNSSNYSYYGGRGIKSEWKSFEEFLCDMYPSYLEHVGKHGEKNTTLDRVNVNGNYSKENCRWATMKVQNNNSRHVRLITFEGKTMNISRWAEHLGVDRHTLYQRLNDYNFPLEKALVKGKYSTKGRKYE